MEWATQLAAGFWRDAQYALRGMRRRRGFAVLSIATLALGIGVNTTAVAVAYGVLLRPLPYAAPSRVVIINRLFADGGDLGFSEDALRDWLPRLGTLEAAAGYYRREVTISLAGRITVVPAARVTGDFFAVLGVPPLAGQLPLSESGAGVVVGQRLLHQMLPGDALGDCRAPVSVSREPGAIAAGAVRQPRA